MNDFLESRFKRRRPPWARRNGRGESKSAYVGVQACACVHACMRGKTSTRALVCACVNKFFYKPGRAEAATDISSAFAYSWLNLHLAMQMYANIVSEHFKNRNQHSK